MSEILKTDWYGFEGLVLENEQMRVVFLPQLGGKIVSLFDKARQHEWLGSPMRPLKQTAYGDDFLSQDMSGWDEMMPTINRCMWAGADLPDHGEVWSVPWTVEESAGGLKMSVSGTAFPYRLTRSAGFTAPTYLELCYTLQNCGATELAYLWAAHPQFAADAQTRIIFPTEVSSVVNVIDGDPLWGPAGEVLNWPRAEASNGQSYALDRVGALEGKTCRKFYLPPDQPIAWAALADERSGSQLRMHWDSDEVPYCGIWVDEGAYNSRPVVALEPSTGFYDSLELAADNSRLTRLVPEMQHSWSLRLSINN